MNIDVILISMMVTALTILIILAAGRYILVRIWSRDAISTLDSFISGAIALIVMSGSILFIRVMWQLVLSSIAGACAGG